MNSKPFPNLSQVSQMNKLMEENVFTWTDILNILEAFQAETPLTKKHFQVYNRQILLMATQKETLIESLQILAVYFTGLIKQAKIQKAKGKQTFNCPDVFSNFQDELLNGYPYDTVKDAKEFTQHANKARACFLYYSVYTVFVPSLPCPRISLSSSDEIYVEHISKLFRNISRLLSTLVCNQTITGIIAYALLSFKADNKFTPASLLFENIDNFALYCLQLRKSRWTQKMLLKFHFPFFVNEDRIQRIAELDFLQFVRILLQYGKLLENKEHTMTLRSFIENNIDSIFLSFSDNMWKIFWEKKDFNGISISYVANFD